ncbi:Hypothetical predicted protein [Cloeon dipterum]|uniref:Uncharacterized protein n=1 Tax=Cloeon dipterum TaxID=197152 RepID=A0A8S1DM34_9INSE|nr:Hypothetical predicted protein [Cloeon dipterum]
MVQTWKGWRFGALVGGLVGTIALTLYPIAVQPMMDTSKWKKIQAETRRGIKQEEIQPGSEFLFAGLKNFL